VQEVLLRLVGCEQHHALPGERVLASRLHAEKTLEGVDAGAGAPPLLVVGPLELGLHRLRHAPAVGEAKLGEHRARGGQAEVFHEVLPQEPHGYCIEEESALSGEPDDASLRVQLQELLVMKIFDAHRMPPSN
jgi:hypothetical protein